MQAQFLTSLTLRDLPGKWWQLASPLVYYSALLDATITVPVGFVTDTASVPRLPLAYWLFGGRGNSPAVVHDWLYRTALVSRHTADKVFNEALKSEGKWCTTRWPMTAAVMAFGGFVYNPQPGCLDIRDCRDHGPHCIGCPTYYDGWSGSIKYQKLCEGKSDTSM
jgi:hypothetical protein